MLIVQFRRIHPHLGAFPDGPELSVHFIKGAVFQIVHIKLPNGVQGVLHRTLFCKPLLIRHHAAIHIGFVKTGIFQGFPGFLIA